VKVRRVVTGHDNDGRAAFVSDSEVDVYARYLWAEDVPPTYPNAGRPTDGARFFPPLGGVRFTIVELQPGIAGESNPDEKFVRAAAKQGMFCEVGEAGVHTTDSIDFEVILSGQVVLELDDGAEVVLQPGDTVVQNGTRHRWRVDNDEPAVMAVFMSGAHRAR
jgi:uncharacterized cupin superfamily protein